MKHTASKLHRFRRKQLIKCEGLMSILGLRFYTQLPNNGNSKRLRCGTPGAFGGSGKQRKNPMTSLAAPMQLQSHYSFAQ